eukprot:1637398-Prymnesium_polylepis.1
MIICRGGATLNLDSSSHHPFTPTLSTKSFQHFTINFTIPALHDSSTICGCPDWGLVERCP